MPGPVRARDILDAIGLVLGGAVGSSPGVYAIIAHAIVAATGTGAGRGTGAVVLFVAGVAAGALGGLAIADRLAAHCWPRPQALGGAAAGLAAGIACTCLVVLVIENTPLEPAALVAAIALPVTLAIAVFRRLRDG